MGERRVKALPSIVASMGGGTGMVEGGVFQWLV